MDLDEKQRQAVERCVNPAHRTVAVTGPAGSGKTTIMKLAYQGLQEKGFSPVLCAPTGKAAKRIQEATGLPAMTIHRLLEFTHPGEIDESGKAVGYSYPRRTRSRPIDYNAVLCDEYAMVPQEVHASLIEALPHHSILRVFGDANQLAPIEEDVRNYEKPSAFINLLNNFDGVRLETIHRQGEGSGIAANGWKILKGGMPMRHDDYYLRLTSDLMSGLFEKLQADREKDIHYNVMENQIITPRKTGTLGSNALNALLQSYYILDPNKPEPKSILVPRWDPKGSQKLRMYEGDKVIYVANNYDLDLFNGETGILIKTDDEFGVLTVDFGDKIVEIPPVIANFARGKEMKHIDPRKSLELAYCVTTHKAQGSEYQHIIYLMGYATGRLKSRRNYYTAVTRARKGCAVISDEKSHSYALWNTNDNLKY